MNTVGTTLVLLSALGLGAGAKGEQPSKSDKAFKADSVLISLIDQAEVAAPEPGVLAAIAVREGQMVSAGELLAQVDDAAAQIAKRRAQTEYDIAAKEDANTVKVRYAKDALATAKAEFQRANASIEKYRKSVTGSEIDQLRLAAEQAALEVEQAEHNLAVAKLTTELKNSELAAAALDVDRRRLLAPLDGMVVQIKRHRGEWVQAGESVVRVLRLDRLRAEGFVSAKQLDASAVGRPVTVQVDMPGQPKAQFSGKLVFVSPEVNPVNGQIRVWAELENQDLLLRPGVAAEMTIEPAPAKQF
jgi:macrolide-specific efflux system membrane fusion protein